MYSLGQIFIGWLTKIVSEYDQEIPQSQTADPTTLIFPESREKIKYNFYFFPND